MGSDKAAVRCLAKVTIFRRTKERNRQAERLRKADLARLNPRNRVKLPLISNTCTYLL